MRLLALIALLEVSRASDMFPDAGAKRMGSGGRLKKAASAPRIWTTGAAFLKARNKLLIFQSDTSFQKNNGPITPKTAFIGRNTELAELGQFLASPQPQIAVIHGRQRAGKSWLTERALHGQQALIFRGLEGRPKQQQIRHFMSQLQRLTGCASTKAARPHTWEEALMHLYDAIRGDPRPIVLDELQWMANYRRALVSELKSVWDLSLSRLPAQKLILCGSIGSFMTEQVIKSSALHGRVLLTMEVKPFKLFETQQLLAGRGIDEVLQAQMLTGGIPLYLQLLRGKPSVQLGLEELAFRPNGYFTTEYDRIFLSHFGRNPAFLAIVAALAKRPMGLMREALVAQAGLSLGGRLSEHLRDLETAGFLNAEAPFHRENEDRDLKYSLSDAYLRFYFSFIRPNMKKIQRGQGSHILTGLSGSGALASWMGHAFEHMCVQHAMEIAQLVGFSAVDYSMGPYFVPHNRGPKGLQVDLVYDRADNVLTVCEMKYSTNPVGLEVISAMKRKVDLLRPLAQGKTFQPVLIVHPCATRELINQRYFYKIIEARQLINVELCGFRS